METLDYLAYELTKLKDEVISIQVKDFYGTKTKWIGLEDVTAEELHDALEYILTHKKIGY
jgi:hypothetical protein